MRLLCKVVILAFLFPLSGCATMMGDATYVYEKIGPDQCVVTINSRRSLTEGGALTINGCNVVVDAKSLDTNASRDLALFNLLGNILLPRANPISVFPPAYEGEPVNESE